MTNGKIEVRVEMLRGAVLENSLTTFGQVLVGMDIQSVFESSYRFSIRLWGINAQNMPTLGFTEIFRGMRSTVVARIESESDPKT
jgi:hypothetical protein